jgi:hypothetical protein
VPPRDVGRLAYNARRSSSIYVESDWYVGGGIDVAFLGLERTDRRVSCS